MNEEFELITVTISLAAMNENSRPLPSSKKFHFQNEAKCETFVVEMSFNYDANKTHFHNKGFALSLVLKVKLFGTRKWPNSNCHRQTSFQCSHAKHVTSRNSAPRVWEGGKKFFHTVR